MSFPSSMPRITAVDECDFNFSNAPKNSQMLPFCTRAISGRCDVRGGTHATKPLKTKENLHYILFLPHRDACENMLCSIRKHTFFLTDRSLPYIRTWLSSACVLCLRPSSLIRKGINQLFFKKRYNAGI
jgi:hypothetical protein